MNARFLLFVLSLLAAVRAGAGTNSISIDTVTEAEKLNGLHFSAAKNEMLLDDLRGFARTYQTFHRTALSNSVVPAVLFNPIPIGMKLPTGRSRCTWSRSPKLPVPSDLNEIAFASVGQLAALIRSRQITSEQLTRLYLGRLKKYGPQLHCVVTLTEERALAAARQADRELAAGHYRGPLHGIPYGVKDLLSTRGYPTTWGAPPFKDRVLDADATVIQRLDAAGAVLVAKLSMGELAMGDVWFGGKTRNPWKRDEGSGGSSAGPASATAAGLVAFSIGSETYGSIIEPCAICGATGLRPTYGRISRTGAMSLSWTMDKLGPICRTVEDCAMVLNAIQGPDGIDQTLWDVPFNYRPKVKLGKLRIGYLKAAFEHSHDTNGMAALDRLRALGAHLIPIELPAFNPKMTLVLRTEAAAAFDEMTRDNSDDQLVQQDSGARPNTFREAQFIPAVEYLRAQRLRFLLIQDMARVMENIDVYVAPTGSDENVRLTNLTGYPAVVAPDGFEQGTPTSISFIGRLFGEADLLAVAKAYEDATTFHLQHPRLSDN